MVDRMAPARHAARAVAVAVAAALCLLAAGCSDGDDESSDADESSASTSSSTSTTASTPSTTGGSTTSGPTTATTTTEAPATTTSSSTTTTVAFDGGTDRVEIPRPATTLEVVAHTELQVTGAGGEERITFTFEGSLPGVVVEPVERPVREAGSGDEVAVAGEGLLGVRFEPAASATLDGEDLTRTYTGPNRVPGPSGGNVTEVVKTGDFEAVYEWVVGLAGDVPFRVEVDGAGSTVTVVVPAA